MYVNLVSFSRKFSNFPPWNPIIPHGSVKKVLKEKIVKDYIEIPSVRHLPFIGTTLDIVKAGGAPKFHEYIDGRHKSLGPIFRERVGPLECLFVSDPDAIREIFLHEGKFPRHPIPDAWRLYERKYQNKRGLLFMDGKDWLYHRKIMNSILLNRDCSSFNQPISNSVSRLLSKWSTHESGKPLPNLESDLYLWSLDTIVNLMVGSQHENLHVDIKASLERLSTVLHRVFETSARLFLLPPQICEFLGMLPWRNFEEAVSETLSIASDIITKCLNCENLQDGILLEMHTRNIPREYIERIIVDLIIAAGDTTSFTTLWLLHTLGRHDEVQEDLRAELKDSPGDEIPLLRAVLRETLRLFPVAPFLGRIIGGRDVILQNYRIDQEVMAIVSLFTSSRDAENFGFPEEFMPRRWLRSGQCHKHKPQASLPFALGARSCIGQKIATKQICELVRQLLGKFHLEDTSGIVSPILHLITVPDKKIQLTLKNL
ncbi:Cytochrome P450 315a1, mitochondrial [Sergentomyia squamirostris]